MGRPSRIELLTLSYQTKFACSNSEQTCSSCALNGARSATINGQVGGVPTGAVGGATVKKGIVRPSRLNLTLHFNIANRLAPLSYIRCSPLNSYAPVDRVPVEVVGGIEE